MTVFSRRTYSLGEFGKESFGVAKDFKAGISALAGLSSAFRERIILAVTGVNDCRYCRFVHTRVANRSGLTQTEIDELLEGDFTSAPADEQPALEFARRWAQRGTEDDPAETSKLIERYGPTKAEQIEICCRLIRLGNLTGNTIDAILFKMSKGALGN